VNTAGWIAAAACVFSASVVLTGFGEDHEWGGGPPEGSCRVIIPAGRPAGGVWRRTIRPGRHLVEARAAVAAINAAGSALELSIAKAGSSADIVVADDTDLPGNRIGQTEGCLGPGQVPAASTITLERNLPAPVDRDLIMTRQIAVAVGLGGRRSTGCSTLAVEQQAMKAACGSGYRLLQPVDEQALRRVWGSREWPTNGGT
jgi:hypothetical protein